MITPAVWLTKLILAHLLTDFILQPKSWVTDRNTYHFKSVKLYWHGGLTALVAALLLGGQYWPTILVVWISHTLIDGWKSYQPQTIRYFVADQAMHLAVILVCWYGHFFGWEQLKAGLSLLRTDAHFWKTTAALIFLTSPAGILIGQLTSQWRDKIEHAESLANAGKWIGIMERLIVFTFVCYSQFSAIGLLVAAKGIIRFNEKERPEIKTEYLVIGTLMSIGIAVAAGLLVKAIP